MEETKENSGRDGALERRELMKFGVVTGVAAAITPALVLAAPQTESSTQQLGGRSGQAAASAVSASTEPTDGLQRVPVVQQWPQIAASKAVVTSTTTGYNVFTKAGWKNTSGRHGGNGPVDVSTTRLVDFTANFSESQMTPEVITAINYLMLDYLACVFSGYETDAVRAAARMSQRYPMTGDFKATVYGYGITTTPEMAAFANGGMGRLTDFDDHNSILVASCIAMGEALHSTGAQVMQALSLIHI